VPHRTQRLKGNHTQKNDRGKVLGNVCKRGIFTAPKRVLTGLPLEKVSLERGQLGFQHGGRRNAMEKRAEMFDLLD